ncbi:MAG: DNA helicase RecQ [Chloracidobacterium sp.]|nr:DNA helicase RecQ [Chloracidobacterium sp.]
MQPATALDKAREILKHNFGYDAFRPQQEAIIEAVAAGKDCLVLMPTGGGKSICYQVPALMMEGLAVVISPLIALMKDQVDALKANGIEAAFLNSTQTTPEQVEVFQAARNGKLKLLYVSPERLLQSGDQFLEFLKGLNISLFAIDEAHCISSWGHDFRPEYLKLALIKEHFTGVPVVALTATADKLVRGDIVERLKILHAERFVSSFNRPNIYYAIEQKQNSYRRLLEYLSTRRDQSGIIYCLSRASVDSLAADLTDEGYSSLPYHAGLDKATRDRNQQSFINDDTKIVVATIAFGMGIDKSNVRFVVHMDLPKNIESYYQETGRAGRDGLPSEALLFYSYADVLKLQKFAAVEGNREQTAIMLKKLDQMAEFGDLRTCRRRFLLNYFSEELNEDCGNCDNCVTTRETFDGTIIAQKALSAVARTGQRFGVNYLIDFLRGSEAQAIRDEHKNLKTYGVGSDVSKNAWFEHFKDLIAQGYLTKTDGQYPVVTLTDKSGDVLTGNVKVQLTKARVKVEKQKAIAGEIQHEKPLFDHLRQLRAVIAKSENLPPYIVFSDATLVQMAAFLPLTEADMRRIMGVGDVKWEKYGRDFLNGIKAYCSKNSLTTRMDLNASSRARKSRTRRGPDKRSTFEVSLDLFRSGMSVEQIARTREMAASTIEGHLAMFIPAGTIELRELVSKHKIEPIRQAIALHGDQSLGLLKTELGDDYSYGEIRAVIASMQ